MIEIKKWTLFFLLTLCSLHAMSQITVRFSDGKKDFYTVGDKIALQIKMKCSPETCLSGMKQSKVFVSGLDIETQTDWKEVSKATFQKQLLVKIVPGKKNVSKLTIMRKVDKESLFYQEVIPVK